MNSAIRTKLCIMTALEYVVWASWLPLLGLYLTNNLHFTNLQQPWIFNAFAIASLTALFFGGQLADRYFAQERFLAFSHLIGGLAMVGLTFSTSFGAVFGLMMLHCFFYVPTLSIANSIAFANLSDSKDFGFVRAFGTIGWILASLVFLVVPTSQLFTVSAIASFVLAAFCLTLPHTPPAKTADGESAFAPLKAIKLLAVPTILVLFIVTFFDSLVHYCFFFWTSRYFEALGLPEKWIAPAMSVGQVAEISTMLGLSFFLKKMGWRTTMILGILGQAVRFGIYSIGTPDLLWLVILANVAHGFAYAFFFATVYIFVDESFPTDVRTSAQSLFNLMILGIAQFAANFLWGWSGDHFKTADGGVAYHQLFLLPFGFALFAAALLALFFHPDRKPAPVVEEEFAPVP
jgi:nucleoside transporter